jgi:hypothetical protein
VIASDHDDLRALCFRAGLVSHTGRWPHLPHTLIKAIP